MVVSRFVVLDVFWDSDMNKGSIHDIKPLYDGKYYWWKCFGCGRSYLETFRRVLLDFRMCKSVPMNNFCFDCKYSNRLCTFTESDMFKLVDRGIIDDVSDLFEVYLNKDNPSCTFVSICGECGNVFTSTQSMFKERGKHICGKCFRLKNLLGKHGSLADARPDVIGYYSAKNSVSIDKVPVCHTNSKKNSFWVICPSCNIEQTKRLDAIVSNGAYCGPCAKHKNAVKFGDSLYDLYPDVADMFDKGGNSISSKDITVGSHKKYNFKCENKGIPHVFKKMFHLWYLQVRGVL